MFHLTLYEAGHSWAYSETATCLDASMAWRRTKYQRSGPHQSYLRTSLDGPGVVFVAFIWPDSCNCCSEVQILRYKHSYLLSWQNKNRQCWSRQLRPSNDLLLTMLQSINDWMKRSKGIADVMRHCSRRKDCKAYFRNLFEKRKNVQRDWKKWQHVPMRQK